MWRSKGQLPAGARPDLSVDGTIQLEKLDDVVYVGRPVFGQENATVQLFKIEPDGKYANKVKVTFGRSSVNTIEIKSGLNVGRPGDSCRTCRRTTPTTGFKLN